MSETTRRLTIYQAYKMLAASGICQTPGWRRSELNFCTHSPGISIKKTATRLLAEHPCITMSTHSVPEPGCTSILCSLRNMTGAILWEFIVLKQVFFELFELTLSPRSNPGSNRRYTP